MQEITQELIEFMEMSKKTSKGKRFDLFIERILKENSMSFDIEYVLHTAWAARILARLMPSKHVDFSSSTYFSTLVSAFIPIDFYDYRPLKIQIPNLQTGVADLTKLPFEDDSIPSLSCMHVIEHIGLGRYGDPLDPEGDLKAIAELKRVMSRDLLFAVPIGKQPAIIFNLHRVYSYAQIMSYFEGLKLMEFALISDAHDMFIDATKELVDEQNNGCGCFWFRKD